MPIKEKYVISKLLVKILTGSLKGEFSVTYIFFSYLYLSMTPFSVFQASCYYLFFNVNQDRGDKMMLIYYVSNAYFMS